MEDKKRFYPLDEIGFVGTQEYISEAQRKRFERLTGRSIRAEKARIKEKQTKSTKNDAG